MKKFDLYKTIQLVIFIVLAAVCLYMILSDRTLFHLVANDPQIRTLCILLWVAFGLCFLFIFMDFSLFSTFKRDYRELDYAVSSDPVSGIANRYSCDTIIEKYVDKPLPDHIGCIMFDLTNIREVNRSFGHGEGNTLIHDFSGILQTASMDLCFVGRNGGNRFLALFEDCTDERIQTFLDRVDEKVGRHNKETDAHPILYRYGIAFDENSRIQTITDLIALSNRRIFTDEKGE